MKRADTGLTGFAGLLARCPVYFANRDGFLGAGERGPYGVAGKGNQMSRTEMAAIGSDELAAMLSEIARALRLFEEGHRRSPRAKVALAIAAVESAREDLLGKQPH